jgi:protein-S-isoprenylcysteine O-methyltransferase Ste14
MIIFCVLFSYCLLIFELTYLHTPSISNTSNFFGIDSMDKVEISPTIHKMKDWSLTKKFFILIIPNLIIILICISPLYYTYKGEHTLSTFSIFGGLLCIVSRILGILAIFQLRINNRQEKSNFTLHIKGFYSITRNPSVDTMILFLIGLTIVFPKIFMVVGTIIFYLYHRHKILIEEEFLQNIYGDEYLSYKKRTKRFLFLW